jgi:hypothetical protein
VTIFEFGNTRHNWVSDETQLKKVEVYILTGISLDTFSVLLQKASSQIYKYALGTRLTNYSLEKLDSCFFFLHFNTDILDLVKKKNVQVN